MLACEPPADMIGVRPPQPARTRAEHEHQQRAHPSAFRRLRAGQREAAVKEVKSGLLLEKIAQAENIQVSDQEFDQEIASLAQQMQQTPEQVRQKLREEGALERIRARIRNEKALNFLYDKSE